MSLKVHSQTRTTAVLLTVTFLHAMAFFAGKHIVTIRCHVAYISLANTRGILSAAVLPSLGILCHCSRRQVGAIFLASKSLFSLTSPCHPECYHSPWAQQLSSSRLVSLSQRPAATARSYGLHWHSSHWVMDSCISWAVDPDCEF